MLLKDVYRTIRSQMAPRRQGAEVRALVLAELLRREVAHEPPPTWPELGAVIRTEATVARYHCVALRREGLVAFVDGRVRTLVLTDAGRLLAQR